MSVRKTTKSVFKLGCEWEDCQHKWESDHIPDRCASCKRPNWNRGPTLEYLPPVTAFGKTQTVAEWGRELGMNRRTIAKRLKRGLTPEQALSKEDQRKKKTTT
jgi:hypothetical protein